MNTVCLWLFDWRRYVEWSKAIKLYDMSGEKCVTVWRILCSTEFLLMIKLIQMYLLHLLECYKSMSTTCLHSHFHLFLFESRCTCSKYKAKTGNNVGKFTYSNWITQTFYSSPKHKSPLHRYLIHFSTFCTL